MSYRVAKATSTHLTANSLMTCKKKVLFCIEMYACWWFIHYEPNLKYITFTVSAILYQLNPMNTFLFVCVCTHVQDPLSIPGPVPEGVV